MIVKRFEDIHVAFAKAGAPLKKEVAKAMGMRAETFSIHIRNHDAKVSPIWAKRFIEAWDQAKEKGEMIQPTYSTIDIGATSTAKVVRHSEGLTLWIHTGAEDTLELKFEDVDVVAQLREAMGSEDVEAFISGRATSERKANFDQTIADPDAVDGVAF